MQDKYTTNQMELHFAPLQGYADHIYRRIHNELYGGVYCYYTPFIRIEKGEPRHQDMNRLKQCAVDGTNLIPQIIFNSLQEFTSLVEAIKVMDYNRIDLNLGCPHPMQTGKGRGSALIANTALMSDIADYIAKDTEVRYSVKMRLGMSQPDEWEAIMPILNSVSLEHVTLHPRVAKQMYNGDICYDQFKRFLDVSSNPVVYNGDIKSVNDLNQLSVRFPSVTKFMIGRGMLARPSLALEYKSGNEWSREQRITSLLDFHDELLDEYQTVLCGQAQVLQKIKPFWDYLESEIGHKVHKAIKKATSLQKYKSAISEIE